MGASGSNNKKNKNDNNLKRIIFLYYQAKEFEKKIKDNKKEIINSFFYILNETIEKYSTDFNIEEILNVLKKENYSINSIDYDKLIKKIKKDCKESKNETSSSNNAPINELSCDNYDNVKYPHNFFIIEIEWFEGYKNILEERNINFKNNIFHGMITNDYIIIENNNLIYGNWDYLACSLFNNNFYSTKE